MTSPFTFKQLALASVAALCALQAHAQSQVTVYGLASVEALNITGYNSGTAAAPSIGTQRRLDNSKVTNSRLGFKGYEDLGSGLGAVFGIESAIALDTGSQANAKFWNRGSYVGLTDKALGTLTFGRQWNIEDSIMSRYFIGAGYAVFQFSDFGYISDLVDNSAKYVSPTLGGFTVQGLVAAGEGTTGRTGEIGATYVAGPFEMGGTYRTSKNLAGTTDKQAALGVSYAFGKIRLHGGIAQSDAQALGLPKARAYDLGVVWDDLLPLTQMTLDYVKRDQLDTADDSSFVRLQGTYFLSKRTALFANLVTLKNQGQAKEKFYGNGAPGQNQNVVSLGIRHWF